MQIKDLREVIDYMHDDVDVFIGEDKRQKEQHDSKIPKLREKELKESLKYAGYRFADELINHLTLVHNIYNFKDIDLSSDKTVQDLINVVNFMDDWTVTDLMTREISSTYRSFVKAYGATFELDCAYSKMLHLAVIINEEAEYKQDYELLTGRASKIDKVKLIKDLTRITDDMFSSLENDLGYSKISNDEHNGCEKLLERAKTKYVEIVNGIEVSGLYIDTLKDHINLLRKHFESISNTKMTVGVGSKSEFYRMITLCNNTLETLMKEATN